MKKSTFILLILLLSPVFSNSVFSQVAKGMKEFTITGSFNDRFGGDAILSLSPGIGYFLTDNHEIGGKLSIITSFEATVGQVEGFYNYNITTLNPKVVPFLSINFGTTLGSYRNAAIIGLGGGVKAFISDGAASVIISPKSS